jgi:pimeloyl-ACP methyl ester carboxylesterase
MTTVPTTKYARSGDVHIAYQVVGEGPHDLVLVPGWVSHIEYAWEEPSFSHFLRRLASFSRLILLDRRGTGLSDRVAELPTLEQRMDDIRAVMDAASSERAALFGISEGGPMCLMFAATYPARTRALILYATFARMLRVLDYPIGLSNAASAKFLERIQETWGTGTISADLFAPSLAHDQRSRQSWARFERFAVSPAAAKALFRMLHETDARHRSSVPTIGRTLSRRIRPPMTGRRPVPRGFVASRSLLGRVIPPRWLAAGPPSPEPPRRHGTRRLPLTVPPPPTSPILGNPQTRDGRSSMR